MCMLVLSGNVSWAQYTSCLAARDAANTDQDAYLTRTEYAQMLSQLSDGSVDLFAADDLPLSLQNAYLNAETSATINGTSLQAAPIEALGNDFCTSVYGGLFEWWGLQTNYTTCIDALMEADGNTDGLIPPESYAILVADVAPQSQIAPTASFDSLSEHLQQVFTDYSINNNLSGTTVPTQAAQTALCLRILLALALDTKAPPVMQPTNTTTTMRTPAPTLTPASAPSTNNGDNAVCIQQLAQADSNTENQLTMGEYMVFIGLRIGQEIPADATLESLPMALRDNFAWLKWNQSYIDIQGAADTSSNNNNAARLNWICQTTDQRISEARNNVVPDLQFAPCVVALGTVDADSSKTLDEKEYATFATILPDALAGSSLSSSASAVFADLPVALQENYRTLTSDSNTPLSITGAQPQHTLSNAERSNLQTICSATTTALNAPVTTTPAPVAPATTTTTAPQTSPTTTPATTTASEPPVSSAATAAPTLSSDELQSCRTAMVISDLDRDDGLSETEYLRFLNRLSSNAYSSVPSYDSLDDPLKATYTQLATSASGTIDIAGSKPGQTPSESQLNALRNLCAQVMGAIRRNQNGDSPTALPNPNIVATPAPTVTRTGATSSSFAMTCRTAMIVSDTSRDNLLDAAEFARFINRLTANAFPQGTLDSLDPVFQNLFTSLKTGGSGIDVAGSKPGSIPTAAQSSHLDSVCSATEAAVNTYQGVPAASPVPGTTLSPGATLVPGTTLVPASPPGTAPPGSPTTASPTVAPTAFVPSTDDLEECATAARTADVDIDGQLTPEEYVTLLNALTDNLYANVTFANLDAGLQSTYQTAKGNSSEYLVISDTTTTTEDPTSLLRQACDVVLTGIQSFSSFPLLKTVDTQDLTTCLDNMEQADANKDNQLDSTEYGDFVNYMSNETWKGKTLEEMPYVIRDNFDWVKWGDRNYSSVAGAGPEPSAEALPYLTLTCNRTYQAIAMVQTMSQVDMLPHCLEAMTAADTDQDNALNPNDYAVFVNYFSGYAWNNGTFADLEPNLQSAFELYTNANTGMISIEGSKPGSDTSEDQMKYLQWICTGVELNIAEARYATILEERCQYAMFKADANKDKMLSKDEYADFVYDVAGISRNVTFDSLDPILQFSYNSIATSPDGVEIPSLYDTENWRLICSKTSGILDSVLRDTQSVLVYNGFVLENKVGLRAMNLTDGPVRWSLDEAYDIFVQSAMNFLEASRLQSGTRRLETLGLVSRSSRIYEILDVTCPSSVTEDQATCSVAFASFELMLRDEEDLKDIQHRYSTATRKAINNGELQNQLTAVDSSCPVRVVQASDEELPPNATSKGGLAGLLSFKNHDYSIFFIFGAVAVAVVVIVMALLHWCHSGEDNELTKPQDSDDDQKDMETGLEQAPGSDEEHRLGEMYTDDSQFMMNSNNSFTQQQNASQKFQQNNDSFDDQGYDPEMNYVNSSPNKSMGDYKNDNNTSMNNRGNWSSNSGWDNDVADAVSTSQSSSPSSGRLEEQPMEASSPQQSMYMPRSSRHQTDSVSSQPSSQHSLQSKSSKQAQPQSQPDFFDNSENDSQPDFFTSSIPAATTPDPSPLHTSAQRQPVNEAGGTTTQWAMSPDFGAAFGSIEAPHVPAEPGVSESDNDDDNSEVESDDGGSVGQSEEGSEYGTSQEGSDEDSQDEYSDKGSGQEEYSDGESQDGGNEDSQEGSDSGSGEDQGSSQSGSENDGSSESDSGDETIQDSVNYLTDEERRVRAHYRGQVEALMTYVMPDELENLDAMMDQFAGREAELVATLSNMAGVEVDPLPLPPPQPQAMLSASPGAAGSDGNGSASGSEGGFDVESAEGSEEYEEEEYEEEIVEEEYYSEEEEGEEVSYSGESGSYEGGNKDDDGSGSSYYSEDGSD
jgi:hypothetical protein